LAELTVVIGAGPVGCLAALAAVRTGPVVLVARHDPPSLRRVDSVPAPLLGLLVEFGIHPAELGVQDLCDTRTIAWDSPEPDTRPTRATAHVARPDLDFALRRAVARLPTISVVAGLDPEVEHRAARTIDASGRAAVSAIRRVGPPVPFVARTLTAEGRFAPANRLFRLAAQPEGYVYRLATPTLVTFGIVAPRPGRHTPSEDELRRRGLGWMLDGLPPLGTMAPGRGGVASVQWSEGADGPVCAGDAALARDPLSSQGIANGLSDALAAVEDPAWLNVRHSQERRTHLTSLVHMLDACWCGDGEGWDGYRAFLREHMASA
jgi:hypothetical protein